jgi:hypothetical protein
MTEKKPRFSKKNPNICINANMKGFQADEDWKKKREKKETSNMCDVNKVSRSVPDIRVDFFVFIVEFVPGAC